MFYMVTFGTSKLVKFISVHCTDFFLGTYILVVLVSCIMCVRTWRVPTEPTLEDQSVPGTEYGSMQRNENENAEMEAKEETPKSLSPYEEKPYNIDEDDEDYDDYMGSES